MNGIQINWSIPLYPAVDKIDHYRIEKTYGNITEIEEVAGDETSHLIIDVLPVTDYVLNMVTCIRNQPGEKYKIVESIGSETVSTKTLG